MFQIFVNWQAVLMSSSVRCVVCALFIRSRVESPTQSQVIRVQSMHWNDLRMPKCGFACADLWGYERREAKEAQKK